jgi:hypothetical protein
MPSVVKVLGGYLEVDAGGTGGGSPPGIWGGGSEGFPTHPIAPGGPPPGIWGGTPAWPSHPIAPGGAPPGIWGGAPLPHPSHPIAPGGQPPGIWGGTPPVYIDIGPPGQQPQPPEDPSRIEWHTGWTADKGWVTVGIVTPDQPIPTPSA